MQDYQRQFIEFALAERVLKFGHFVLKSGRESPYFFDSGLFNDGRSLHRLGEFYAAAIIESGIEADMLYGPAYKGIPLVSATAAALFARHQRNLPYCFNRKEVKDHGEGGSIVGAALRGRVLIIDDVISAGTSVRESVQIIDAAGATPCAVTIALDRQERGRGSLSAIEEVERDYNLTVVNIICLADLITFLQDNPTMAEELSRIKDHRARYGSAAA